MRYRGAPVELAEFMHKIHDVPRRSVDMSPQFRSYVANINRIHLAELIGHHPAEGRMASVRPSLVANPWTGEFYGADRQSNAPEVAN